MHDRTLARAGAACGAVFAVALTVANGNGQGYSAARFVVGEAALVLFVPFLVYLWSVLRQAEGASGWLSTTALGAGVVGITLKLASGAPEIAMHRAHVADGTQLHEALDGLAGAMTVMSLYPLALLLGVVAVLALRTGALPRWLGLAAAGTAAALAVNGAFHTTESVPALLLFILWTLVASVTLYRRTRSTSPPIEHAYPGRGMASTSR
jgi:hypothetical protein